MSSRSIVMRLSTQEASDVFFRDLALLLEAVAATCSSPTLKPIAEAILPAVMLETGMQQEAADLQTACRWEHITSSASVQEVTRHHALQPQHALANACLIAEVKICAGGWYRRLLQSSKIHTAALQLATYQLRWVSWVLHSWDVSALLLSRRLYKTARKNVVVCRMVLLRWAWRC